ncbi:response regulator transcription factor [Asticcacaulis sp. EMRT-3]|uniref:response regulator transcription factor n=1 Tax=Asticcacaulis sp. EMRT-3 TaxID=3040349 RepID=UPI0024AEE456|nr:response regulator transcription factor [Asticcacaulis sp. EMRT-3]MDI7775778.1 response regulator transcription factor [Asticcacaulis sp. EMRT-3]
MRVLLVEDDELLGRALKTGLEQADYNPEWVTDGETALEALRTSPFAVMALDLNLPGMSGIDVLKKVRQTSAMPIVIMTARDALEQRIEGLDLGADDYLVKPFKLIELLARIRAVVRRAQGLAQSVIVHRDIELDMTAHTVRRAGKWVKLTAREYKILALLMTRIGRIMSKSEIEEQVYSWEGEVESNTIEAAVYTIRKKLGKDLISNVRGVGYVISD